MLHDALSSHDDDGGVPDLDLLAPPQQSPPQPSATQQSPPQPSATQQSPPQEAATRNVTPQEAAEDEPAETGEESAAEPRQLSIGL